jgi:hypothetical protein
MAKYIATVLKVFSPQNQNVPYFVVEEAVALPFRHQLSVVN